MNDVLKALDFDTRHLESFSARVEAKRLDESNGVNILNASSLPFSAHDGWHEGEVKLRLPCVL